MRRYSREQIYQAAFDLVADASIFRTMSRRTMMFTEVTPDMHPAMFMEQIGENPYKPDVGMPYRWTFEVTFGIYVYSGDSSIAPASLLNPILDYMERKLDPVGPQTLGDMVFDMRLSGDGKAHAGSLGPQAFAFIPARITVV